MVLNKDFSIITNSYNITQYAPLGGYLALYSTASSADEVDYSLSAAMLAAYRGGICKNVTNYSATDIRNEIVQSNCLYVALMGDGDEGEVSCYYVNDPVDDKDEGGNDIDNLEPGGSVGNGIIPTDFYFELLEDVDVGSIPDSWSINSYVGRVVGTSAQNILDYIDLVKRYEMGLCSELAKESSLVGCITKEWDFHVWPIQNWLNWGIPLTQVPPIYSGFVSWYLVHV